MKVACVDIGRSGIKSALFEVGQGRPEISGVEWLAMPEVGADLTVALLGLLRKRISSRAGVAAVGIATAGQVSRSGYVSATIGDLYRDGCALGARLGEQLQLPVLVRNDVQLMTLAEARYGAGQGWPVVLGVAIGSGVGGGIVREGKLDIGADGIAGECGHVRAVDEGIGRPCWCGGRGCLDVQVSGLAIEGRFRELTGREEIATDILREAVHGGPAATVVRAMMEELATGLETLACCLNPSGIILGGSIGVAIGPLLGILKDKMSQHPYVAVQGTTVRVAELGVHAQLYGAAVLCESAC
jgi:glucokinase